MLTQINENYRQYLKIRPDLEKLECCYMQLPYCEWTVDENSGDFVMFCNQQNKTAIIELSELEKASRTSYKTESKTESNGEAILANLKLSKQLEIGCDQCDWLTLPVSPELSASTQNSGKTA